MRAHVSLIATLIAALPVPAIAAAQANPGRPAASPAPAPLTAAQKNAILTAPLPADQAAMKAHVMFLASDAMRGRDAGSAEYAVAAQYVAAQFYAAGLSPAGDDGGYLQHVPLIAVRRADMGVMTLTPDGGAPRALAFAKDYVPGLDPTRAETTLDAPLAFAGYGIVAPTVQRDDYAGIDVTGRIVLLFAGAPPSFEGEEHAHFGSPATKAAIALAHGAAGVVIVEFPAKEAPFARIPKPDDAPRVTWADTTGWGKPTGAPILGTLSAAAVAPLFGADWGAIEAAGKNAEARPPARLLPARLAVTLRSKAEAMPSSNVVGLLPGSDTKLAREVVVLSAHLDHVGVGKPVNGDAIYNGAEDNAVGIASLIEEAKRFRAAGKPPRRSILFLAVTAEEKGLVGSDYFATHPTIARERLVADVNLDMPVITYAFEDVIAFGAQRSTLGPIVTRAAASIGVGFSPDPMPEMGLFVRSDHYRFVQQGVPSVFLWPGHKGPGKVAYEDFFAHHYHKPSDEVAQSPAIDWAQGVRFVAVNYAIAREIADAPERPRWNKGDFFGLLYNGYGAR